MSDEPTKMKSFFVEWELRNQNPYAVTLGDMEPINRWEHLTDEDVKFLRGLKIETGNQLG